MDDLELIGLEYIWRLVLCSNEEIANRAIDLLRDTFTNLGPRLQANQVRSREQRSDRVFFCKEEISKSFVDANDCSDLNNRDRFDLSSNS